MDNGCLCYSGSYYLSILYIVSTVYIYQSQFPSSPHLPLLPWYLCVSSLHLCLYLCFANKITDTIFLNFTYMCKYIILFSLWYCTLYEASRSIHISANSTIYFFLWLIHSSADAHLGCFHVLAVNRAAMNIEGHVSYRIMVFSGYMPSSWIAGSHGNTLLAF